MKLVDFTLTDFVETLGSEAPAPGGGAAAALTAATGISLTKMVCELTLGKPKYEEYANEITEIYEATKKLQNLLLAAIDKDTAAYSTVSAVFKMPKTTETDKIARRKAMQTALEGATESPFEMMGYMVDALKVTKQALGKSNTNAVSDLGVAALNLKAGLQGAWLNVLINLSSIKNQEFTIKYRQKGEGLLQEGCILADEIYTKTLEQV